MHVIRAVAEGEGCRESASTKRSQRDSSRSSFQGNANLLPAGQHHDSCHDLAGKFGGLLASQNV